MVLLHVPHFRGPHGGGGSPLQKNARGWGGQAVRARRCEDGRKGKRVWGEGRGARSQRSRARAREMHSAFHRPSPKNRQGSWGRKTHLQRRRRRPNPRAQRQINPKPNQRVPPQLKLRWVRHVGARRRPPAARGAPHGARRQVLPPTAQQRLRRTERHERRRAKEGSGGGAPRMDARAAKTAGGRRVVAQSQGRRGGYESPLRSNTHLTHRKQTLCRAF